MKKRQPHKNIPEGCFEEEQGRDGFYGPVSHLIRRKPSTRWTHIEGNLKPRLFDLTKIQEGKDCWEKLLYNDALCIHFYRCLEAPKSAFRSADGDLLFFCHEGKGLIFTEYGLLHYSAGTYISIPKCLTHAFVPENPSVFFVIESLKGRFHEPDRGLLGRHGLYAPAALVKPDLPALKKLLRESGRSYKEITVFHQNEMTRFQYESGVFDDAEDWAGDLFPFTLDMKDIMPIASHRVHLPPSAHTTFATKAKDCIVCSFLPRPLEEEKDALKVPFYHQNIDYDEVLFYHKGDFFSRDNLRPGMMSLHPAGFPHGPHPKAVAAAKNKARTDECAVMTDSRLPLFRTEALAGAEDLSYWKSWR